MRKLKFRAWNKKIKSMGSGLPLDVLIYDCTDINYDDLEIMQYTGLKDMENREIYEGDIVEGHADGLGKVVWQGACWTYEFMDSNTVSLDEICIWFGNNAVVIGNIYENPELLKNGQ